MIEYFLLVIIWASPIIIDGQVWTVNVVQPEECAEYFGKCFGLIKCESWYWLVGCYDRIDKTINMDVNHLDFLDEDGLATFEHELKHIKEPDWLHKDPFN